MTTSTTCSATNSHFEMICLEPEQKALFQQIIEAHKKLGAEGRRMFFIAETAAGTKLIHPNFPEDQTVSLPAIEEFDRNNLISLVARLNFSVTANGNAYYEYLQSHQGEQSNEIEASIQKYLATDSLKLFYPAVYDKWSAAAETLCGSEPESELPAIVRNARESVQAFADEVIKTYDIKCPIDDRNKEIAKIRFVLGVMRKDISKNACDLDTVLAYWDKLTAQAQRQEHSKNVTLECARRVVFQAAVILFEVEKILKQE